jgi:membrane dipeptidase
MVKHIDHIKNIAGIETLALGSDFDGIDCSLEIPTIAQMDLLKNALNTKGFSCEEIDKIFFKNAERVFREVLK